MWLGSDPAFLWPWHRLAATAPIQPLAWELPYAAGMALKSKYTHRHTQTQTHRHTHTHTIFFLFFSFFSVSIDCTLFRLYLCKKVINCSAEIQI